jgi:hypothetical protein
MYNDIIRSEEGYLKKDPRFSLSIAEAVCTSLTDNFHTMQRPGYDDYGSWSSIDSSLRTIVEAAKPILSAEEREETAEWIEAMYNRVEPYGLVMDYESIMETAKFVRRNDDGKKSEETEVEVDDRKPAAVATTVAAAIGAVPQKKAEEATVNNDSNVVKENFVNSDSIDAVEPSRE